MNPFAASRSFLLLPASVVKACFHESSFRLASPSGLPHCSRHAPNGGRCEPKALPCNRFPQKYGLTLSGGWTGCGCRHPNVPTTANGCAFTLIFATSMATQRAHPQAAVLSWPSSPPRTSPWPSEAKESPQPACTQHQNGPAATLPDIALSVAQAATHPHVHSQAPGATALSPARISCPGRRQSGRSACWHPQTGFAAHLPSHFCKSSTAGWLRPPGDSEVAGSQRHQDHDDILADRAKRDLEGGQKPAGLPVICCNPIGTNYLVQGAQWSV